MNSSDQATPTVGYLGMPIWLVIVCGLLCIAGCSQPKDPALNEAESVLDVAIPTEPNNLFTGADDGATFDARDSLPVDLATVEFEITDDAESQPVPGVQLAVHEENVEGEPSSSGRSNDGVSTVGAASPSVAKILSKWPKPKFTLFITGRQHGYIEPCGCTGLENAKGGLSRRQSLMQQLRDENWNLIAVDVGNQVRRFGKQSEIKFQRTIDILRMMKYDAIGFGPDDLRMSLDGLLAPVSEGGFVCANVDVLQLNTTHKVIASGGTTVGITGVLGLAEQKKVNRGADVLLSDPVQALEKTIPKLRSAGAQFNVLLAHASLKETRQIVQRFPNVFDVVVTAGGAGEPTREPEKVPGSKSQIVQVGTKGMYVGIVGVFDHPRKPIRYERVELDARFADSKEVLEIFADYQKQLEIQGLEGLGIRPVKHSTGHRFVGYEKCGECHTQALEVFESTPHHHATQSLVTPPNNRVDIPRHFDPECLSCHVTGWNPQEYFPYDSGYLSLSQSALHTNGCENCHGPGSAHVAAEEGEGDLSESEIEKLRSQMRLTLEEARESSCFVCHDIDNSPDFEFDSYWEKVKHVGKD